MGVVDIEGRQVQRSGGSQESTILVVESRVWIQACVVFLLVLLHFSLLIRINAFAHLGVSILVWPAVIYFFVQHWRQASGVSPFSAQILGVLVLALTLSHAFFMHPQNLILPHLYPLLVGVGFILVTGGFRAFGVCWRELVLLFSLGVPRLLLWELDALRPATATLAGFAIWYFGQEVEVVDTYLFMPKGAVVVDQGCAGPAVISYLISLSVLAVFLIRMPVGRCLVVLMMGPAIAFMTNVFRVMVLALLEGSGRHEAFSFWHGGSGSSLWSMIPIVLFGAVIYMMTGSERREAGTRLGTNAA
jgi:cyanoexosortase A